MKSKYYLLTYSWVIVTCPTKSTTLTSNLTFFNGTGTRRLLNMCTKPHSTFSNLPILLQNGMILLFEKVVWEMLALIKLMMFVCICILYVVWISQWKHQLRVDLHVKYSGAPNFSQFWGCTYVLYRLKKSKIILGDKCMYYAVILNLGLQPGNLH